MDEYDYERIAKIEKLVDEVDKHRDGLEDRIDAIEPRVESVLEHAERVLNNAGAFSALDLDTISKWQDSNDTRYEELLEAHNSLNGLHNLFVKNYNEHIIKHQKEQDRLDHLAHVVSHNAHETRLHQALIVGAIALAAFALGRSAS